jgi:flavin-dependent dehydrogenase
LINSPFISFWKIYRHDFAFRGFGVSRYELDKYLYNEAIKIGCTVVQETVSDVEFLQDTFTIVTNLNTYSASIVLGAFGKRSNLDIKLKRSFIQKQSHWLGVKAHYKLDFQKIMLVYIILKEDIVVFLR